jgi:next-to-BRCA1 protein 1
VHEDQYGRNLAPKGDRCPARAESSKAPTNAATQVQTIIDVKPAEAPVYKPSKEKIEIKDLLAEPIQEKIKVQDLLSSPVQESKQPLDISQLNAIFVREVVQDGSPKTPETHFSQCWTLRNPGPAAWPAGCRVQFTGGDNMFELTGAPIESNAINRAVGVGAEVNFSVSLKAPAAPGTKISYWRLKTVDGQAFGHRLWCHVNVSEFHKPEASPLSQGLPPFQPGPVPWRDNFLQQTLQHRLERAQAIEKQRVEFENIKARHEAKQLADSQARAHRAEMLRRLSSEISAVETQHKARMAANQAAKAAIDSARAPVAPAQSATELPAAPAVVSPIAPPPGFMPSAAQNNHALQDWQMQLMLLEQQNKKRLLMARQLEEQKAREFAQRQAAEKPAPVEVEAEVKPVTVEDVVDEENSKPEEKSNMIFPKLDKESPVSSTADVSASAVPAVEPASPAKSVKAESEIFEDAESVSFVDSSDEEDGFLTDEEYDILDASDEDVTA